MKESKKFSLSFRDLLRGMLIAILTPVLFLLQKSLEVGQLTFDWHALGMAAVGGFLAYLIKNFFTDAEKPKQTNENNDSDISSVNH